MRGYHVTKYLAAAAAAAADAAAAAVQFAAVVSHQTGAGVDQSMIWAPEDCWEAALGQHGQSSAAKGLLLLHCDDLCDKADCRPQL